MEYVASVSQEAGWWVLHVQGVGTTQCRKLSTAPEQILGLVEAVNDAPPPADAHVRLTLARGESFLANGDGDLIVAACEWLDDEQAIVLSLDNDPEATLLLLHGIDEPLGDATHRVIALDRERAEWLCLALQEGLRRLPPTRPGRAH